MATYIRLTDYKSSDEKEKGFFDPKNRYEAKQEDFEKIPGSPIAYWVSDKINRIFENNEKLEKYNKPLIGMRTGDNNRFLREWFEVETLKFSIVNEQNAKWFPYAKGGEFRRWYGNNENVVNWLNDGYELKENTLLHYPQLDWDNLGWKISNESFYFKKALTWTCVSSTNFSVRFTTNGFLFDTGGSFISLDDSIDYTLLGFLNSKSCQDFLMLINPTINYGNGTVGKLPIILPKEDFIKQQIETLTQQNIDISKVEWDSRETSWDFAQNELLRILNDEFLMLNEEMPTLETVYNRYCEYWKEKFFTLHKNEEELNRLFIDIYELQDELTPDVELKDITILKNEAKIVGDALVFQREEIMKQFISYSIGVMFGRYSLDHKGLHVANMNESLDDANSKFNIQNPTFEADDDNIIPVLEDDYFKDDIASRFVQFVKTTFGEENLSQNLRFIESSLGTTLRKYFVKGFYEDHIKRYKKRPIYWMVASPKKGFMSLIYMHRYEADTFARVRNSYLTEYIAKLEAHKETLTLTTASDTASNKDKKDADKAIKNIETKLKEIIAFDRDAMMHYAQNSEEIDLDDGVKVNYCKFKDILYPIKGLCK